MCDYLMWEERCKIEKYRFRVLDDCKTSAFAIDRVYPLKQRSALAIYNVVQEIPEVLSVYLIGSSISMKCTQHSDIDLILEVSVDCTDSKRNDISCIIQEVTG